MHVKITYRDDVCSLLDRSTESSILNPFIPKANAIFS